VIGLIFDKDSFKILSLFSASSEPGFNRSQIKEKTVMNNVPLDNALAKLVMSKLLTKENNVYRINTENKNTRRILKVVSKQHKDLNNLPLNIYFSLIDLVDYLASMKKIDVYLFGFYAGSDKGENSNIDIALLAPKKTTLKYLSKITGKVEKNYGKTIKIHDFIKDDFYKNKSDPVIKEILQNGIRLM